MKKRYCKDCGKDISDRGTAAFRCVECQRKANLEAGRLRIRKPTPCPRRKSGDFLSIDEVVALAAKAGLSYGEYVRRYGA